MFDYALQFGVVVAGGVAANVASHYVIEFLKN
jgi:hypothetical protein